ncbi:MAG: ribonuclease R [Bacteroidales bacterium]
MFKNNNRKKAAQARKQNSKNRRRPQVKKIEYTGVVSMTREGYAFIVVEGLEEDIFVSQHQLRGALNGDTVKVAAKEKFRKYDKKSSNHKDTFKRNSPKKIEGQVIDIIERSKTPHIGILQITRNEAWVIMESRKMPYDISIPMSDLNNAFKTPDWTPKKVNGLKVAAIVKDWPIKSSAPIGTIIDVLGKPGENDTEMHAILSEFGLPYRFEPEVEDAANKISEKITSQDIAERRDFRKVTTFTIDPKDAKDFDDALSYKKLENGNVEIGVHIADVTHYVKPDSVVDKCAYERGTSVYLVDRTVPMLPEELSNKLCSLRPNEEKLTFSAVFELNEKAEVLKQWFGKTIIESNERFDYAQAQEVLDTGKGRLAEELKDINGLATILRKNRFKAGAVSFERPEMKVEIDDKGKAASVYQKISTEANWLIEEFMLLANRSVAESVGKVKKDKKAKTFVYRIHENPNEEKVSNLRKFAKVFGYELKTDESGKKLSSALNTLLSEVKGSSAENAIEIMALRSMMRAKYTTENVGHYGLAFNYYTHFTSPIRRYPDMMVHRLLEIYLQGQNSQNKDKYEEMCNHCSEREQLSTEAERASTKYKLVEFMLDKIGKIYPGTISGLTDWGMYVEINPTKVEGMVALRSMEDDYYLFDEDTYSIKGKSKGKVYHLGDPVYIKVTRASLEQKIIDYELITDENIIKASSKFSAKPLIKKEIN